MNVILPATIYSILNSKISTVMAIVYSGFPPVIDSVIYVIMDKRLDIINCVVILATIVSVIFAISAGDAKGLLLKDSIITALCGFGFLSSLLGTENLCFMYYRMFSGVTDDDKLKLDKEWTNPVVKRDTIIMTWVFGLGYLIEAVLRVILLYVIPLDPMVYISIFAPLVFTGSMGIWCYFFVKRMRQKVKIDELVPLREQSDCTTRNSAENFEPVDTPEEHSRYGTGLSNTVSVNHVRVGTDGKSDALDHSRYATADAFIP
jgi:hypothetical protein